MGAKQLERKARPKVRGGKGAQTIEGDKRGQKLGGQRYPNSQGGTSVAKS